MSKSNDSRDQAVQQTARLLVENGAMCAFLFTVWVNDAGEAQISVGCAAEQREMFKTLAQSLRRYAAALDAGEFGTTAFEVVPVPVGDA